MNIIGLVLIFGLPTAALLFTRFWKRKPDPRTLTMTVNEQTFSVTDRYKVKSLIIGWQDVTQVTVILTDKGPFTGRRFYHVVFTGGEITLPEQANNLPAFLMHLSSLPGFNALAYNSALRAHATNSYARIFTA